MNRHIQTPVVGTVPIVALATVLSLPTLTVPCTVQGPGPVFDVLSDVEGKNIILASDNAADSERSKDTLDMTTVTVRRNLTLLRVIGLWFGRDNDTIPIETVFPPGQSQDEVEEEDKTAFTGSEANVTSVALAHLGLPMEVTVAYTAPDSSVDSRLHEDDVILAVDGVAVSKSKQVKAIITGRNPGDTVTLRVKPATADKQKTTKSKDSDLEKAVDISVTLAENPHQKNTVLFDVGMGAQSANDTKVEYQLSSIRGPSAGLMMTLRVIDKPSPGDLTERQRLAGTSTIDATEDVGKVGDITHKASAARDEGAGMLFVPKSNCAEAVAADRDDIKLVEVSVLDNALTAIEKPETAQTYS